MLARVCHSCYAIVSLFNLLLLLFLASRASGDFSMLPESSDTFSENGAYMFRIIPKPHSDKPRLFGTCRGMLYAKKGAEMLLQWERPLVNDICPLDAYVSNSGKYVITVGEWHEYEKLAVVVYGVNGCLVNVYGELRQIVDLSHFVPAMPPYSDGEAIAYSNSGWHWLSRSLMFFGPNDEYFVMRLRNKDIVVLETATGQLIDGRWKAAQRLSPNRIEEYDAFKKTLGRLAVLKALKLAASDLREEKADGQFVLNQCRDHDSIHVLEQALKDSTSKSIDTPQGRLREYPIRKAAKKALEAAGEKVPESIVTEEKVETKEETR